MKNIMLKGLIIIVALVLVISGLVMWTINTNRRMNVNDFSINRLTVNGTLNLKNLEVQNLELDHQNGSTIADNLKIDDRGTITKKNGKTSLDGVDVNGLSVSIKNGGFTLNGVKKISSNKTYNDHKNHQLKINSGSGQVFVKTK